MFGNPFSKRKQSVPSAAASAAAAPPPELEKEPELETEQPPSQPSLLDAARALGGRVKNTALGVASNANDKFSPLKLLRRVSKLEADVAGVVERLAALDNRGGGLRKRRKSKKHGKSKKLGKSKKRRKGRKSRKRR